MPIKVFKRRAIEFSLWYQVRFAQISDIFHWESRMLASILKVEPLKYQPCSEENKAQYQANGWTSYLLWGNFEINKLIEGKWELVLQ